MLDPTFIEFNPWWISKDTINQDKKIIELANSKIHWDPRIRHTFDYSKDIVYSLRGPRQVGKTTLIKLQIKNFLEKGVSPWNIFYYSFDLDNSAKDVQRVIKNYLENTLRQRIEKNRCYIFLDEVSSVKNWQKAIKLLVDMSLLKNCTVVVTGSHSIDLKRSNELLPGRKGETDSVYDKIMLPMKFSEYVSSLDDELKQFIELNFRHSADRKEIFEKILKNKIDDRIYNATKFSSKLDGYLLNYLITGGIPKVVDEYQKKNRIDEYIYTTYFDSIIGDIKSLEIDQRKFKRFMSHFIKNIGWPISWNSIQKDTEIGSWSTISRYANLLEDMFIIILFFQYDSKKKSSSSDRKKIYFHDTFFFHVLNSWTSPKNSFQVSEQYVLDESNKGHLIEGIIGDHLIRLAFSMTERKQRFDHTDHLFYWKYDKDKELDYVFYNGDKIELPIEVKYQKTITNRDLDGINNFKRATNVKNALLITKDQLAETENHIKIPASLFLLLV